MKKLYLAFFLFCTIFFPAKANLQTVESSSSTPTVVSKTVYYKAEVVKLLNEKNTEDPLTPGGSETVQQIVIKLLEGPDKNRIYPAEFLLGSGRQNENKLVAGAIVYVTPNDGAEEKSFYVTDRYRLPSIIWLLAIFFILTIIFAGWHGLRSLLGLSFTIAVIMLFILPRIIAGDNPFIISLIGALVIAIISLYLAHGFNKRTSVALLATLITIIIAIISAISAVHFTHLFGLGSEEALYIQISDLSSINLRGLLLGGIIIGVLGVLDDITTAQVAAVAEIHRANPRLTFKQLYQRGQSVGKEHIASLVNTLALAYVGASFPLLLLFIQYPQPLQVLLNSEMIVEEIVRTLIGSSALIIAVPIATALAARFFGTDNNTESKENPQHAHHH